jgi:YVTN family beta-propeller protein
MRVQWLLFIAAFAFVGTSSANGAEDMPLVVEAKIPLGDIEGRMDHLAYDPGRGRLYVAELGNDTVGIVDLTARRVMRTVKGFKEPQGIAWEPNTDTIYVAGGGDGTVRLFSGSDFSPVAAISLGSDADNVRVHRASGRVYVGYGEGALAIIDTASRKRIGDIALKGHPESFQLDPNGKSIYVNVPDAGHIAVAARDSGKQVGSWDTGSLRANYPLAIDAENQRVIAIFRQPAKLQAYNTATGRVIASADVCSDSDDVFVDAKRHRVYVVCGGGQVDTFDSSQSGYTRIGQLATSAGSRTGLLVPELDRLIVAIRAAGREPAALWVLKPVP